MAYVNFLGADECQKKIIEHKIKNEPFVHIKTWGGNKVLLTRSEQIFVPQISRPCLPQSEIPLKSIIEQEKDCRFSATLICLNISDSSLILTKTPPNIRFMWHMWEIITDSFAEGRPTSIHWSWKNKDELSVYITMDGKEKRTEFEFQDGTEHYAKTIMVLWPAIHALFSEEGIILSPKMRLYMYASKMGIPLCAKPPEFENWALVN